MIKSGQRNFIGNVKATFIEAQTTPVHLSIFITESNIISKQKLPDNSYDKDYINEFILRKGLTPYNGLLLSKEIEIGRVFVKGVEFTVPDKYILENCSLVVLINRVSPGDNEVLNCIEASFL